MIDIDIANKTIFVLVTQSMGYGVAERIEEYDKEKGKLEV